MADETIIIGAGASGLTAARILSRAGKQVKIVEARDRPGGRILSAREKGFSTHIEAGAEFIHGRLPETLQLLDEAGLSYYKTAGEIWNARRDEFHQQNDFIDHYKLLVRKLKEVKRDMSVKAFLELHFSDDKYNSLRNSIAGYVQGYDLAELDKASTFSLKEEWLKEDDEDQFRITEGYGSLVNYLMKDCEANKCSFEFNTTIRKIEWAPGDVKLFSADNRLFECTRMMVTVPLGI